MIEQGKLKLVEPSEIVSKSYIQKSKTTLGSSKLLFSAKHYEDSIALIYYSMYYSLQSLLFRVGIKSENHTASIILLELLFDFDISNISLAKQKRIDY